MIFEKKRVEEDLKKIRKANLTEEEIISMKEIYNDIQLEKYDLLAMFIAVISLILPYIIIFMTIMTAVVFLLTS